MSNSPATASTEAEESKPKYRPHLPNGAGTLLDEQADDNNSPEARSTADRLRVREERQQRDRSVRECYYHGCETTFDPSGDAEDLPDGYNNQYHSRECWARQVAARLIRGTRLDHKYCASCFEKLKEIEVPPENANLPDCVVGYQYFDPTVTERGAGEIIIPLDSGPRAGLSTGEAPDSDGAGLAYKGEIQRCHCGCGPTHHATVWSPPRTTLDDFIDTYIPNLIDALDERRERGAHDYNFSEDRLYDEARDLKTTPKMQRRHYDVLEYALAESIAHPYYTSK